MRTCFESFKLVMLILYSPLNLLLEVEQPLDQPGGVDGLVGGLGERPLGEDPPGVGVDGERAGHVHVHVVEPVLVGLVREKLPYLWETENGWNKHFWHCIVKWKYVTCCMRSPYFITLGKVELDETVDP